MRNSVTRTVCDDEAYLSRYFGSSAFGTIPLRKVNPRDLLGVKLKAEEGCAGCGCVWLGCGLEEEGG